MLTVVVSSSLLQMQYPWDMGVHWIRIVLYQQHSRGRMKSYTTNSNYPFLTTDKWSTTKLKVPSIHLHSHWFMERPWLCTSLISKQLILEKSCLIRLNYLLYLYYSVSVACAICVAAWAYLLSAYYSLCRLGVNITTVHVWLNIILSILDSQGHRYYMPSEFRRHIPVVSICQGPPSAPR